MGRTRGERPVSGADASQPQPRRPSVLVRITSFISIGKSSTRKPARTAPDIRHTSPDRTQQEELNPLLSSQHGVQAPSNNEHTDACPNDPKVYYSFPKPEKKGSGRDLLCGICRPSTAQPPAAERWPSMATEKIRRCSLSRPCTPARAGQPCAHLASNDDDSRRGRSRPTKSRLCSATGEHEASSPARSSQVAPSSGPRRLSLMKRINETLAARRSPVLSSTRSRPPTRRGPLPPSEQGYTVDSILSEPRPSSSGLSKPSTPKVHRLLVNTGQPYVRKHEVDRYLAELGAVGQSPGIATGASSTPHPALGESDRARRGSDASRLVPDTVFYPMPRSVISRRSSTTPKTPSPLGRTSPLLNDNNEEMPHIRGGGCDDTYSAAYLVRFVRCICATGVALLPSTLFYRVSAPPELPPARVHVPYRNPLAGGTARCPLPRAPGGGRWIPQWAHSKGDPAKPKTDYVPRLRGGGGESHKGLRILEDKDPVPAALWFFAGGKGIPITKEQWNRQKPKKRAGGLLGVLMYGNRAGQPYKKKEPAVEKVVVEQPVDATPAEGEAAGDKPADEKAAQDRGDKEAPDEKASVEHKAAEEKATEEKTADDARNETEGNTTGDPATATKEGEPGEDPAKSNK